MKQIEAFWKEEDEVRTCAFGLPIVMMRNWSKAWCGYVGVDPRNTAFFADTVYRGPKDLKFVLEAKHWSAPEDILDVHGGITWAKDHLPLARPDGYFWYGFDCGHYMDYSPYQAMRDAISGDTWRSHYIYRTKEYVLGQCRQLASQLSDFQSNFPEHF